MQTLTVYYVGSADESSADENYESTPDDMGSADESSADESSADESTPDLDVGRLINTDVDEPGDLREWLGDKLEQQQSLLKSRPENTFEGVQITVSRDADVKIVCLNWKKNCAISRRPRPRNCRNCDFLTSTRLIFFSAVSLFGQGGAPCYSSVRAARRVTLRSGRRAVLLFGQGGAPCYSSVRAARRQFVGVNSGLT